MHLLLHCRHYLWFDLDYNDPIFDLNWHLDFNRYEIDLLINPIISITSTISIISIIQNVSVILIIPIPSLAWVLIIIKWRSLGITSIIPIVLPLMSGYISKGLMPVNEGRLDQSQ